MHILLGQGLFQFRNSFLLICFHIAFNRAFTIYTEARSKTDFHKIAISPIQLLTILFHVANIWPVQYHAFSLQSVMLGFYTQSTIRQQQSSQAYIWISPIALSDLVSPGDHSFSDMFQFVQVIERYRVHEEPCCNFHLNLC